MARFFAGVKHPAKGPVRRSNLRPEFASGSGQDEKAPTPQIERGRELFTNAKKGVACNTGDQLGEVGTAIVPRLTNMASNGRVHSIVMTMHMTEQVLRVKSGERLPLES